MFCIHKTCLEGKQRTNLISYLRFGLEMIAANWSWLNSLNIDENFNSAEKLDMMNSLHQILLMIYEFLKYLFADTKTGTIWAISCLCPTPWYTTHKLWSLKNPGPHASPWGTLLKSGYRLRVPESGTTLRKRFLLCQRKNNN